ncbi:hypothetical protein AAG906_022058 [Vitis piasezkii]
MGRAPCCAKEGLNRGAWTVVEDNILTDYIQTHGEGGWRSIPKNAGLKRCGKSCRLRWLNYLKPDIKRGNISHAEEDLIIRLHRLLGNRWSMIAKRLPGRTDNEIKNYWNTNLRKKVKGKESNKVDEPAGVIRTKAFRCTGVFIAPPPPKEETATLDTMAVPEEPCMMNQDLVNNAATSLESQSNDGALSMAVPDINSSDFSMNFDIGDHSPTDIFDSEFWKACNLDNVLEEGSTSGDTNDPWPSSDQFLMFSDEMIKDWIKDD